MRIRRILAAGIATAALAGLGLTGAATATAQGAPSAVSPSECRQGGGEPRIDLPGNPCVGGTYDGQAVD
ncbi:hypothetical protein BJY54_003102 [Streptomyces nodosus]|uniref:Uncharacterized protein n=1 Tax=Streptomyces nodosus TaxID=40318 RepID=A0A0B5DDM4_9ACTN|nr:hypothetical protein [Streptomyces nodosus]AJE41324.1 hypothetical protein SNOD_15725 [Streptomyces nodosus]MBB4792490.1 hypothetical protein [Streptomyces nodosus]QEV39865.1 hypothetical protein CP978_16025 [Streptomyces nodosus]